MRFLLFICTIVLFTSCENPDEWHPVITSVLVNEQDESHFLAIAGEELIVTISANDDQELKQIMLKLKKISGIHHQQTNSNDAKPFLGQLSFGELDTILIKNVNGKSIDAVFSLVLPDSIGGGWAMEIGVLDVNGNYTSQDYTLHIHNNEVPFVAITDVYPAANQEGVVVLAHADSLPSFRMSGFLVDHSGLDTATFILRRGAPQSWQQQLVFNNGTWSFDLSNIFINDTLTTGTYTFEIIANDIQGWSSTHQGTISIP